MAWVIADSGAAHTMAGSTDGNNVTTTGINTSTADFIGLVLGSYQVSARPTISDLVGGNANSGWIALTDYNLSALTRITIFYLPNPTFKGSGHTFSAASSTGLPSIGVIALSGSHLTSPFVAENGATNSGATSLATGSVTPNSTDDFFLSGMTTGDTDPTQFAIDSSFTLLDKINLAAAAHFSLALGYKIKSASSSAENPIWSWSSSNYTSVNLAAFKVAAASGHGPIIGGQLNGGGALTRGRLIS